MTHAEIAEMLGAYALNALDDGGRRLVDSHLATCPSCAAEVADHREVAGFLAAGWLPAPDGLWERIAESLVEVPPPARVIPLLPEGRRRRVWARISVVAAVVAALVIGALGGRVLDDDRRFRDLTSALAGDELVQAANAAAAHPDVVRVALRSAAGDVAAEALVLPDGSGFIKPHGLPRLDPDRTYQLWGVVGPNRISLGVLGPEPQISAFRLVGGASALAVTTETAGGVAVSQHAPVVMGSVETRS